ncbi:cysteine desulfurase [Erysipelotrichaceae bacterium OttesenSCG-928-M19]|nr:cysteine desulfurase [Erysipelotrichaceae bacterium OttesenSCG-928-M19]
MYDINEVRKNYPMLNGVKMDGQDLVYLDSAATALKPQCVIDKVVEYYAEYSTNAHRGDYALSHRTDSEYENVRKIAQRLINAKSELEIVYTYGTTHGINMLAHGIKHQLKKGDVILLCEAEHASNVLPWFRLKEEIGIEIEYIPLNDEYKLTLDNFKKAMHDKVKIVSLAHIGNVLGFIIDMKEITKIAHEYGALVAVDGAQSVPHIPVDVQELDIDFLNFSAHKLGGPSGIGVFYGKYDLLNNLEAYNLGGGMNTRIECNTCYYIKNAPFKFEAGTPAIEATIGMGRAMEYIMELGLNNIHQHLCEIRKYAIDCLQNEVEGITIYNPDSESGPIAFNVIGYEGARAQDIGSALATRGIAVRTGEHCAKLLVDVLETKGTVRASLYLYNSKADMDRLVEAIKEIVKGDALDWLL